MNIYIKNILAVLNDRDNYEIKKTDVFISGDIISGVGEKPDGFTEEKVIDGKGRLLIPGLINSHTHAYMSLFRNMADDLAFDNWLFKKIMPMEDKLSPEDAYWGSLLACAEMIKTGTTCFLDMHLFKNQTAKAVDKIGMRAVVSRGLVGDARNDEGGIRRINEAFEEAENWKGHKRISFMLAPHAIYTCGTDYLKFIAEKAAENNFTLNIHLSETRKEVCDAKEKYNMTPVEYLNSIGFFDIKTVAAHCVHLEGDDVDILKEKNVSVAANPISNMKLGNGFAPVYELMNKGVNVCLGTDSAASNNTLNLFSDMNHTALIHKGVNEDAQAVSAFDVYKFATINGAQALNIDAGIIKCGMKADLAVININCPQFYPRNNLMSALSYSANGSEVDTVIVDGNIVMENKKLCFADEEEIYSKAEEIIQKLKC